MIELNKSPVKCDYNQWDSVKSKRNGTFFVELPGSARVVPFNVWSLASNTTIEYHRSMFVFHLRSLDETLVFFYCCVLFFFFFTVGELGRGRRVPLVVRVGRIADAREILVAEEADREPVDRGQWGHATGLRRTKKKERKLRKFAQSRGRNTF